MDTEEIKKAEELIRALRNTGIIIYSMLVLIAIIILII